MQKYNYINGRGEILDTVHTHSLVLATEYFELKHYASGSNCRTIAARNLNGTTNCTFECDGITVEQINNPEPIGTEWIVSDGTTRFSSSIRPAFNYAFLSEAIEAHKEMQLADCEQDASDETETN
jgi:hypothetical protein